MCLNRFFLGIIFLSSLEGERYSMVTCTTKTQVSCSLYTYIPDCEPWFMTREFPMLFGDVEDIPDIPLNFKSKVISKNGTVGILLIWQQFMRKNPPVVQGFQLVMEGKDGIDFGSGRCFILQLQNKSLAFNNAYETFYLIVNNVLPKSSYTFTLHSLPRFNPLLQYRTLKTEIDTNNYGGEYPEYPSNWDQSIECIYNGKTQLMDIYIEIPPENFGLTLFEVNIFDGLLQDVGLITVNASNYDIFHDEPSLFINGYIFLSYSLQQNLDFAEVWVTPIDIYHYIPSKCLCYTGNRLCNHCRTATTKCAMGRGIIDVLPYNLTMNAPGANKPVKKSDLIAWLFVGAGIISASICAFIVFRRQHSLCKDSTYQTPAVPLETTQTLTNERPCSSLVSIPGSLTNNERNPTYPDISPTHGSRNKSSNEEESLPLVDSCSFQLSNDINKGMNDMIETYFSFVPPDTSEELSKTISDQMIDINREFLPSRESINESRESCYTMDTNSLGEERV